VFDIEPLIPDCSYNFVGAGTESRFDSLNVHICLEANVAAAAAHGNMVGARGRCFESPCLVAPAAETVGRQVQVQHSDFARVQLNTLVVLQRFRDIRETVRFWEGRVHLHHFNATSDARVLNLHANLSPALRGRDRRSCGRVPAVLKGCVREAVAKGVGNLPKNARIKQGQKINIMATKLNESIVRYSALLVKTLV